MRKSIFDSTGPFNKRQNEYVRLEDNEHYLAPMQAQKTLTVSPINNFSSLRKTSETNLQILKASSCSKLPDETNNPPKPEYLLKQLTFERQRVLFDRTTRTNRLDSLPIDLRNELLTRLSKESRQESQINTANIYIAELSREDAVVLLKEIGENGVFIIRRNKRNLPNQPYSMSIYNDGDVKHLEIRLLPGDVKLYALGKPKESEKSFKSLIEMVNYYETNQLAIAGGRGGLVKLKRHSKIDSFHNV